ncbi:MAG: hypothetical protein J6O73_07550 [Lachnospiraceae bacterium]|nr:hypothetical protein [Lachnospiraceae bacterium]
MITIIIGAISNQQPIVFLPSPPSQWDWRQINGFFDEIQTEITSVPYSLQAGYDYVPNRSGGFWGLWYGSDWDNTKQDTYKATLYLQFEATQAESGYLYKICLKLSNDSGKANEHFLTVKRKLVENIENYGFNRPKRIGSGQHITIGIMNGFPDDYCKLRESIYDSIKKYRILLNDFKKQ